MPKTRLSREQIAERAALELPDGAYVNLGWGIPNLIAAYVPSAVTVHFHSENGIIGKYIIIITQLVLFFKKITLFLKEWDPILMRKKLIQI